LERSGKITKRPSYLANCRPTAPPVVTRHSTSGSRPAFGATTIGTTVSKRTLFYHFVFGAS
jgi:hypothetical protein